jgi:hypothetical protein
VWSIVRDDWATLLDQLGAQAAGLKREYFLSRLPVEETITVEVETAEGAIAAFDPVEDWTYDESRNSITFVEYIPASLSTVIITYTVASTQVEGSEVTETIE